MLQVLVVAPGCAPRAAEIDGTLEAMQTMVGGTIQAIYPFEEPVALICNDDGKLMGLPYNRALQMPDTGAVYDIIAGTFFLCGAPPDAEAFTSLTPEQTQRYTKRFQAPELFFNHEGKMVVLASQ